MINPIRANLATPLFQQQGAPPNSSKVTLFATALLASFVASVILPWHVAVPIAACLFGISVLLCCDSSDEVILVEQVAEPHIHAPVPPILVEQRMHPDVVISPSAPAPRPVIINEYHTQRYPTYTTQHVYGPRAPVGTGGYTPPMRATAPPRTNYAPTAPRAPVGGQRNFAAPPRMQTNTPQPRSFPTNAPRAPVGRR